MSHNPEKHNAIAEKLGVLEIGAGISPTDTFTESNKTFVTIDTINTFNDLDSTVSALSTTLAAKSDEAYKLKDSLLAKEIAGNLVDRLVFD